MPHTAVGVEDFGLSYHFRNRKIRVVCIAYSDCDAAVPSKCTMNLPGYLCNYSSIMSFNKIGTYVKLKQVLGCDLG